MTVPARQPDADAKDGVALAPGVWVWPAALRIRFSRSSGPGGQNVNKLSTRAELWVPVDALVGLNARAKQRLRILAGGKLTRNDQLHLAAQESRSQESNRLLVLDRLRQLILQAQVEPKVRKKTKRSRASQQRRLDSKRRRADVKTLRRDHGRDS